MTARPDLPRGSRAPVLRRRPDQRQPLSLAVVAATAYLEARAGRRDVAQLAELVDRRTARLLAAMVRRRRRSWPMDGAITLRRVLLDGSHPGRPNLVVVLDTGDRVVPVCVEVRRLAGAWTVTTLTTPEDHRPRPVEAVARPDWEVPTSVEPW